MTHRRHSGAAPLGPREAPPDDKLGAEPGIHKRYISISHKHPGHDFRRSLRSAGMTVAILLVTASVNAALAEEPFIGRWAVSPETCSGRGDTPMTSALVATDSSLWWFEGHCRIGKMYKAKAVYLQAHCGTKGDIPVTLDATGDRMQVTWDRTKMYLLKRCK
jgi:hypothetical protein